MPRERSHHHRRRYESSSSRDSSPVRKISRKSRNNRSPERKESFDNFKVKSKTSFDTLKSSRKSTSRFEVFDSPEPSNYMTNHQSTSILKPRNEMDEFSPHTSDLLRQILANTKQLNSRFSDSNFSSYMQLYYDKLSQIADDSDHQLMSSTANNILTTVQSILQILSTLDKTSKSIQSSLLSLHTSYNNNNTTRNIQHSNVSKMLKNFQSAATPSLSTTSAPLKAPVKKISINDSQKSSSKVKSKKSVSQPVIDDASDVKDGEDQGVLHLEEDE